MPRTRRSRTTRRRRARAWRRARARRRLRIHAEPGGGERDGSAVGRAVRVAAAGVRDVGLTPLGLGTIGHASCGGSSCGVGRPKVEGARANVAATVVGAANPGDARILAMMRPGLRACANKALQQNPTQSGSLQLSVSIGADGAVTRVLSTKNSGLSADCAACMQRRVGNAQFPATGAARMITVTIAQTIATS